MKKQSKIILVIFILSTALSIYSLFFSNAARNKLVDANSIADDEKYINLKNNEFMYTSENDVIDFKYINDYEASFTWDARISGKKPGKISITLFDNKIKEIPKENMRDITSIPIGAQKATLNFMALGQHLISTDIILYLYDENEKIDTQVVCAYIPGSVVNLSGENYLKEFSCNYNIPSEAKYYKIKMLPQAEKTYMSLRIGYINIDWQY